MTYTHIRPLSQSDPETHGYLMACGEFVCPTHRQICRRDHNDQGCGVAVGCGAGNVFYCKEEAHGCSRKFKCNDFRQGR